MKLMAHEIHEQRVLEGMPGQQIISSINDVSTVLEACFDNATRCILLYPENLTKQFFDLSSQEAGTILQKLRNYHIRLAIVCAPNLQLSRRFSEMMVDENRGPYFRLFNERSAAQDWLCVR